MIIILVLSASILTKAFTGLPLSTYSIIIYIPCADSFEQIYQDQKLDIHTTLSYQANILKTILKKDAKIIDNIIERAESYRIKNNIPVGLMQITIDIFERIATDKLILICSNPCRDIFETKYIKWNNMLSVTNEAKKHCSTT